jgi:peptide deformylase
MAEQRERKKKGPGAMVSAQLRTFGDPTLKQMTKDVAAFDERLRSLVETMFDIMDEESGVGLAAPQIGSLSRVMVWMDPDDASERYAYVNPRITWRSEEMNVDIEGCLSVPGVAMEVDRSDEIKVEACDPHGEAFEIHLTGYRARIVQHEIDHLDGLLIVDRTSKEERRRVLKELREHAMEAGS